jgi:putative flavoprotein involved in K+ transport
VLTVIGIKGPQPHMSQISDLDDKAQRWASDFEIALRGNDAAALGRLFTDDACWRDNVAFTWDNRQAHGRDQVVGMLAAVAEEVQPKSFTLSEHWPAPAVLEPAGAPLVEFFLSFETNGGRGTALVRARPDQSSSHGFQVFLVYSLLDWLHSRPEPVRYPEGHGFDTSRARENWAEHRQRAAAYADREPEVLVVGAGHSGLILAAHLGRLGVDALVVDTFQRIGDNWRNRYHNLSLHTPTHMAQLPYFEFPANFPQYLSKDKFADWLEMYASAMDINCWTETQFLGGEYDEETGTWSVSVRRADGTTRELRPKHVALATGGVGGKPNRPALPGLETFQGDVLHSSEFAGGERYTGGKAIVVGVGTSAHDIAYELSMNGAAVTMVQRNPVAVVSIDAANLGYSDYFNGTPCELVDFRFSAGMVTPFFVDALHQYQAFVSDFDKGLHDGLRSAGMQLEDVLDGRRSWFMKYFMQGGGYYLDVGASALIAAGDIGLVQTADIERYGPRGAVLRDGTELDADVVVLATGYEDRRTQLVDLFGPDVAERIGPIGRGFDETGEWRNVWKPTAHPGLWFVMGGVNNQRPLAKALALHITAELDGLVPAGFRDRAVAAAR